MSDERRDDPSVAPSVHSTLAEGVYSLLVDSIPSCAFYLIDLEGHIRTWNRGAEQLLGYTAAEAATRPIDFIFTEQDRVAELPRALLEACRRSGEVQSEGWRVRKDGSVFWGSMTLAAVHDDESKLIGWSQLVQDKSQQKVVQDALQEREATISALLDSAAQGILAANSSGKIMWANAMSAEMFNYTQSEITSLTIEDLLPNALREKHRLHRTGYFASPNKRPMGIGVDLTGRRKGGEEFPIEVSLSHLSTKSGLLGVAFVIDISRRKHSELLLARSEAMHRMLFEQTPQPMWVHDSATLRFLMVNEAAQTLYGYSKEEFLQMTVRRLGADETAASPAAVRLNPNLVPHRKKSGDPIWVDERSHIIEIGGKAAHLVLVTDVTERVALEDAIAAERDRFQALAGRMREVQEQERLHLSREIHDALGQELTGLKFKLQQVAGAADAAVASDLTAATGSIDKLIAKLRDIAAHLRPPVLDHLDLPDAIEWLSEDFGERAGIICKTQIQQNLPLVTQEIKLAAFRVCQEALTNVQRHAKASNISISLARKDWEILMTIEDDGIGFAGANSTGSLGLLGMRERAESMRGALVVESSPGEGTRIALSIPLVEG
jgi:PAS domain S-box-containing protein